MKERYKRKPVYITAVQWDETEDSPYPAQITWVPRRHHNKGPIDINDLSSDYELCFVLETPNGPSILRKGDWIVETLEGNLWNIGNDMFQLLYERDT